jgi:hypothetical protein
VSEGEIDEALHIFEQCLGEVFGSSSSSKAAPHLAAA